MRSTSICDIGTHTHRYTPPGSDVNVCDFYYPSHRVDCAPCVGMHAPIHVCVCAELRSYTSVHICPVSAQESYVQHICRTYMWWAQLGLVFRKKRVYLLWLSGSCHAINSYTAYTYVYASMFVCTLLWLFHCSHLCCCKFLLLPSAFNVVLAARSSFARRPSSLLASLMLTSL